MNQPAVNIDTLHTNIKTALTAQFPTAFVDFYPRPGESITTPAILLEMEDMPTLDPDENGTEQTEVMLNLNAYVVHNYKTGKKQAVKTLAAAVMAFIRGKRWGCPVGAAKTAGAFPDVIAGKEEDYEVMRVEFSHEALLGIDVWTPEEGVEPPQEVYLGISPLIGPENIEYYERVNELPET